MAVRSRRRWALEEEEEQKAEEEEVTELFEELQSVISGTHSPVLKKRKAAKLTKVAEAAEAARAAAVEERGVAPLLWPVQTIVLRTLPWNEPVTYIGKGKKAVTKQEPRVFSNDVGGDGEVRLGAGGAVRHQPVAEPGLHVAALARAVTAPQAAHGQV